MFLNEMRESIVIKFGSEAPEVKSFDIASGISWMTAMKVFRQLMKN